MMTKAEYLRRGKSSITFMQFSTWYYRLLDIHIPSIGYLSIGSNRDYCEKRSFLITGGICIKDEILEGEHVYKYNFGFGTKRKI